MKIDRHLACTSIALFWTLCAQAQEQAKATASVANGQVNDVKITVNGSGYRMPPIVNIVGGGGAGAYAICSVSNGIVETILVTRPGSNYLKAPNLIVAPRYDYSEGLLGWWRGESNTLDELGRNDGEWVPFSTPRNYQTGMVGTAFYSGSGLNYVSLGSSSEFNFADDHGDFTIETWTKAISSPNTVTPGIITKHVGYKPNEGWSLYYDDTGYLVFTNHGFWGLAFTNVLLTDLTWYHVAVTKAQDTVTLYRNGHAVAITTNATRLVSSDADMRMGTKESPYTPGPIVIDELAIYNRALSTDELKDIYDRGSQGKYVQPIITGQPTNTIAILGTNALLTLTTTGTPPLEYQWLKNGVPITDATNTTLVFTNVQALDTNAYSVTVYNQYGASTSQEAKLVVKSANLTLGLTPKLTIEGVTGKTYSIQYATNLDEPATWTTLSNITLTQPTQIWYDFDTDASLPDKPQRYYQVIAGP